MANNVKFSTGLEEDLLKLNSDKTYVNKIDEGHVYFATKTNDDGKILGSIFYDINGQRISMGGAGIGGGLDEMGESVADKYVTRISSEGTTYASTDGVTITTYNGKNAALDTILLPVAGANRAGVVITGAQTFAGNKTFTGIVHLSNTTDASGASDSGVLIIGDKNGEHLIFDGNEIMSKNKTTGTGTLYLNNDGGTIQVGGSINPNSNKTLNLGSATNYWKDAYISNLITNTLSGHLTGSLTGNVTGNVTGHASLDLPLAGGTMTGDISFAQIATWPTASGETYPIKSKGLKWSGSSDTAAIYYVVEASDKGALYLDMGDDADTAVKFAMGGTVHTVMDSNGKLYPATNNTGSIGTSDNKFASIYATNFYGIIDKAYADESGNNIKATYAATLKNHAHDGSGWSFRLLNKNGGALSDALTIPGATDSKAGLVTTGEQKFAGKKTFSGQVVITGGSDASKATANSGQLIVGDPAAEHLAIDGNEIMAKASGSTTRALLFQLDGGDTKFGGNVSPHTTNAHSLGTQDLAWKEAHIGEIYGHLNGAVTGTLSGNASSASKWLTARKVTMTGDVTGNFTLDGTQDVSYAASIANYSLKPVKLAVHDYANYSQLNRHTAASWGFSVDTTDANGAIYTMSTLARDKFISEEFPCSGGEKFIITYEISTSVKGNSTSGGTDSTFRGTAVGLYGYQYANKNTSAGIAYSTRVTGTASAPWTKVSSVVTVPASARFFYVFVQTESYGNFSGSLKIRNLEVRRASGLDNAGDEILTKYLTRVAFAQENVSSSDTTKKLNLQVYNGNNALKATVQVPNASTTETGVVNTGTQSFAGNKTFTGRIHFSNTTDAAKGSDSGVITIGDKSGEHMLLDGNEIIAKSGASGANVLHIQAEGGSTEIGGNFIPKGNKGLNLGGESNYWKNAYIANVVADTLSGHLTGSLTGPVTGNVTGNLTGNVTGNVTGHASEDLALKDLNTYVVTKTYLDSCSDYERCVIALCETTAANTACSSHWKGSIYRTRDNGLVPIYVAEVAFQGAYSGASQAVYSLFSNYENTSTAATTGEGYRPCIFTYNGKTYAGVEFAQTQAAQFYLTGNGNFKPILVKYYNSNTKAVLNTEVNNSLKYGANVGTRQEYYLVGTATKAIGDESGNNIKASYGSSLQVGTHDGSGWSFKLMNKNNGALTTLTIPGATDTKAGLVTTANQTWTGTKTIKGDMVIQHLTVNTMTNSSANPYLKFLNSDGSQGAMIMFTDYDTYRAPAGLKVLGVGAGTPAWLEVEGALIVGGATTLNGNLTLKGNLLPHADNTYTLGDNNYKWKELHTTTAYINEAIHVNRGADGSKGGIGLYSTSAPSDYGIAMRSNLGQYGYATDTWNTYFSMVGGATRGWVFRNGGTNVASINGQGYAQLNKLCLNRKGGVANGRIGWYDKDFYTWYDYMSDSSAGAAPTGGKPSQMGSVTNWARRSLIENVSNYGWIWESAGNAAASSTSAQPTPIMALASDTGRLYLSNDLMIMMGDTDKFVHYLYATGAGATNYVGASWRAGVLGSGSSNTNYYVIQSGTSSTANTTWENAVRIGQNNYDFTVGTTTKGGIGVANTSSTTGNGISLYGGAMPNSDGSAKSGKPTFGLFFGGTGTFSKYGGVQGDWATYFTMDSTANRGWVFLKGDTAVASISNSGITKLGDGSGATASSAGSDTGALRVVGGISTTKNSYFHEKITFPENKIALEFSSRDAWKTGFIYDTNGHEAFVLAMQNPRTSFMVVDSVDPNAWTSGTWPTKTPVIQAKKGALYINKLFNGDPSYNLHVEGTANITGNVTMGGTLEVTSTTKIKQGSAATAINTGALQVTGGLSTTAASYMNGALTVNSTINATGNIKAPRFIGLADEATAIAQVANGSSATAITGAPGTGKIRFYYNVNSGTAGLFPVNNNANTIITINKHSGSYDSQLGFSSDGNIYYRNFNGSALNTTTGWQMLITTSNMFGELDGRYVNVSGDTMTGMLRVNNAPIFGYRYGQSNNAPAFVFDKPGSNYTGIGANGTSDTIYFSAVTSDGNWNWNNDYKQKWVFNGPVTADAFNGNASSATIARSLGTDESMKLYAQYSNELNFGGTNNSGTIYFGYRAADSKPIPTQFIFGGPSGSATIVAANLSGNASSASKLNVLRTIGGSNHAEALKTEFNSYKASIPRNCLSTYYSTAYSNGSFYMGYFLGGYDSNPYGGFFVAHYGTPYYVGISNGSFVQSQLWKSGDAVTGAVWNDYAECRESDTQEAGYVLAETGKDNLVKTIERLQHFAGVSSDTWGFSQGETEKAKTHIAVAGRVLVYPYQDRNNYKPGDCVCAAPGGKVDIMTREEVINYPDRIVGTVSCVPEYDTWGGGENADRDPVQVNGRIWIKVR